MSMLTHASTFYQRVQDTGDWERFNWGFAAALSVVLLAATLVLYVVYTRFIADMELYESFLMGIAVLVILAGVVFSVVATFTPTNGQRHHIYSTPNGAAAGGGDEDGAAGYPA